MAVEDNQMIFSFIIKPTRYSNFSKFYFGNETLHVSDSSYVHHQYGTAVPY
jgi:hypothetical protein